MTKNIDVVLEKLEKMRESIRLSDELFPIVGDLFMFIKDIIPLMLEINAFMKDSNDKIPTASENISKVTKTTEMAANEVMDKLDLIMNKLEGLRGKIESGESKEDAVASIDEITNDASEIMFAFQFQDITTQQLEHVNRILQAIYDKFLSLFEVTLKLKDQSAFGKDVMLAIEGEMLAEKQKESREYFEDRTADKMRQTDISQDAIDQLFNK